MFQYKLKKQIQHKWAAKKDQLLFKINKEIIPKHKTHQISIRKDTSHI